MLDLKNNNWRQIFFSKYYLHSYVLYRTTVELIAIYRFESLKLSFQRLLCKNCRDIFFSFSLIHLGFSHRNYTVVLLFNFDKFSKEGVARTKKARAFVCMSMPAWRLLQPLLRARWQRRRVEQTVWYCDDCNVLLFWGVWCGCQLALLAPLL